MTEYSDVPKANQLYAESQNIKTAIDHIDNSGSVSSFTVMPAPPPPFDPLNPVPPAPQGFTVMIQVTPPNDPALLAAVRTELVAREQAIATELAALDVTYTPPTRS